MAGSANVTNKCCFALIASVQDDVYIRRGTICAIRSHQRTNPGIPVVDLHHDLSVEQQDLFAGTMLKRIPQLDFCLSAWSRTTRPDIPATVFLALYVERIKEF